MELLSVEKRDQVRRALGRTGHRPHLATDDGVLMALPEEVVDVLAEVLEAAADGARVQVVRNPEELSTEEAAVLLGVSRPTVVRLIESGEIPARKVGTHRRLALDDVLEHRESTRIRRRDALERMSQQAEELGLYE